MSVEGLEMLRKHMAYYDFAPDSVLLLGNVLYYAKKAEVEVAELEAENAKLRSQCADLVDERERLFRANVEKNGEILRLAAENAKLREERDYYKALWEHVTVTDCELRRVRAAWKEDREKNDKLRESLERATGIIADICGECPVSRYEWLSSDGCAEKCGTVTEEECWIAYLTGKRWDESGAEVDR